MRLRKTSIALGAAIVVLAAAGAVESASAGFRNDELRGILLGETELYSLQPNAHIPVLEPSLTRCAPHGQPRDANPWPHE